MQRHARVSVVMLPKCEHAAQIDALRDAVGADVEIIALVESARGVQNIREIAEASGTSRIAFGSIDFAVDLDVDSTAALLDHVSVDIALASRAAGIPPPIAGVTVAMTLRSGGRYAGRTRPGVWREAMHSSQADRRRSSCAAPERR